LPTQISKPPKLAVAAADHRVPIRESATTAVAAADHRVPKRESAATPVAAADHRVQSAYTADEHNNNNNNIAHPSWPPRGATLISAITRILAWRPAARTKPPLKFKMTKVAAKYNLEVLVHHGFNLNSLMFGDPYSPIRPGSEFKPVSLLDSVFQGHPLWSRARSSIAKSRTIGSRTESRLLHR
jgi:hypothetical protein